MTTFSRLAKILLAVLITITSLSLFLSLISFAGTGTFVADYYYLPLREFVVPELQDAMETKVIALCNAQQLRFAALTTIRDALCLGCLVILRIMVARIEDGGETPESMKTTPY